MTPAEKRAKRQARHQVQAAMKVVAIRRMGLSCTGPQIRQAIRTLTDRYYSEQIIPAARSIEAQALQSQPTLSDGPPLTGEIANG